MTVVKRLHSWRVSPSRAIVIQRALAPRVRVMPLTHRPRFIAGADVAFTRDGSECVAGVVVWDMRTRRVVECQYAVKCVSFPYVPGLLSFREAPALLAAFRRVSHEPDVIMLDGQGRAHPRRLGLASHLGLWLDRPTVGCAKSLLIGSHDALDGLRGSQIALRDGDEIVGAALRTRDNVKPVFVSVGHRISLPQAVRLVLACGDGYRLPAPTRWADHMVGQISKQADVRLAFREISARMQGPG